MSVDGREVIFSPAVPAEESRVIPVHLEMRARRDVHYRILHTKRPVFHPQDTTVAEIAGDRELLMVVDHKVDTLYGKSLRFHAERHLNVAATLIIDGSEEYKTWQQAEAICHAAMECGLGRSGIIVGVGGGVVLDVSGFAASIFRRGVGFLRIPTTLIGQVDVSVGVKQGINSGGLKNVLGSFYPPLASINDASFLTSLPAAHIAAGFAEIVKMAMLADPLLFGLVEEFGKQLLATRFQEPRAAADAIMMRAEAAMLHELEADLFESNLQRFVDYGHTFSVVLETDSAYTLPHGHAVGLDMLISTSLAVRRGLCSELVLERLLVLFNEVGLPVSQNICSAERLHKSLTLVRRHRGGALNLVVPKNIGHCVFLQDVSKEELTHALEILAAADSCHGRAGL